MCLFNTVNINTTAIEYVTLLITKAAPLIVRSVNIKTRSTECVTLLKAKPEQLSVLQFYQNQNKGPCNRV